MSSTVLPKRGAAIVFSVFAFAYFLSTLLRAITATLSPILSSEFALQARDLGLLAGGYFFGFSLTQMPMGHWLDGHGPKRVVLSFLGVAVVGSVAFSMASDFNGLLLSRVLIGVGVSACLMAPLTGYRRWLNAEVLQRANSWMLMTGSLGMLASTLPVQWLLPVVGWRWMFVGIAGLLVCALLLVYVLVPAWGNTTEPALSAAQENLWRSYAQIWRHPYFRSLVPMGFFNYGGLVAMQTLWAGPWMVKVAGYSAAQAAGGLFGINVTMLAVYWVWGLVTPRLFARGWSANRLMSWGIPTSLLVLLALVVLGEQAGAVYWALFCLTSSFVALAQPAVGLAFDAKLAGRALSAYNLVLFLGVFSVQWGVGLLIDGFKSTGASEQDAFRWAILVFAGCCAASYAYFLKHKSDS